ncbi:MAG: hypothetical protein ACFFD2_22165, partial [Promethearchaeota archaeon]
MNMYGDQYKQSKSGKEGKEKEDKSDIYKEKTEKAHRFVPSLVKTTEDKTRTFTPSLTPEPKQKRNNFTPSMELPKKPEQKRFTPTLTSDPTKKRRNFTPSLEMTEKKERTFFPTLTLTDDKKFQEKQENVHNTEVINRILTHISELSPKFLEYIQYAQKRGKENVPNPYPNRGTRITDKFKDWIKMNEVDSSQRKQLLKQINEINKNKYLQKIIKHQVTTTYETQKNISSSLKVFGLNVSPQTIKKITLKHIFNNDQTKVKERFPKGTGALPKGTIEEMQELAKSRGGECLSMEYVNNQTKLKWRCGTCNHEWEAVPHSIKDQDTWCPECAGNIKYNIEDMKELAEDRGGKCLSDKYINAKTNLKWECSNGHKWEATPDNVKNKESWCPKCADSMAERTCRQFFEKLFNEKFKKTYPNWLKSPTGNLMHLDGYNSKLKVAFEYQGFQHYIYSPYLHKTIERFKKDQKYDKLKEELCQKQGISLIKVPYTVKIKDMENFIRTQVKSLGIKTPMNPNKIDYRKFKFNNENKLKQMQKLAEARGGKLLSKKYINALTKLEWQCENGHTWWATPNNIKNDSKGRGGLKGNWCPECVQRKKYTLDDIKAFAKSKGGECLSTIYERSQGKLKWRCENNHDFEASFFNVKVNNSWCPECRKEETFQKFKDIAKERGGKCLSENYEGTHSKLKWQC